MISYDLHTRDYPPRIFNISAKKHAEIEEAMRTGKKFVVIDDYTREKVHISNIAGIYKARFTQADVINTGRQLKAGKTTPATKDSPGYKNFLKGKAELAKKKGLK